MSVVVFGSINMDLVVRAARLPQPGETLTGRAFFTAPGGKGANQAVAAARMGAPTRMVGRVGADVFADTLLDGLAAAGVETRGIARDAGSSGVALIAVDDAAENEIIVVPGANGAIGEEDLARLAEALDGASALLLQLEVPIAAVVAAAELAHARGVTVILDPAPAQPLPPQLYAVADILTPNETEAAALVGFPVEREDDARRAAELLLGRGARHVIVKRSDKGALLAGEGMATHYPAFSVAPVDTVAAGDAFNGALAAALDQGLPIDAAIRWGLAAGAISVTRAGAQPSLPTRAEVLALLNQDAPREA